jgi:MFS family permease
MSSRRGITVEPRLAVGLGSLAAAMGIGRFAFTPILPLMQQANGVTLSEGGWLASANYLGYLVGALVSFVLTPKGRDMPRDGACSPLPCRRWRWGSPARSRRGCCFAWPPAWPARSS